MTRGGVRTMSQVLLVCNPLMRPGLRNAWTNAAPEFEISDAEKFSDVRTKLRDDPAIIWMTLDMAMPDWGGLACVHELSREFSNLRVVLVSTHSDSMSIDQVMSCGAAGFIPAVSSVDEAEMALKNVLAKCGSAPGDKSKNGENPTLSSLSLAQLRVLRGIQRGLRNKQIAFEMNLTEKTVKAYMTILYRKLGVSSRTQALIRANQLLR
jgi:DNA-binding NarL/FixJ family response regulator